LKKTFEVKICRITGCGRHAVARQLCSTHYGTWIRGGRLPDRALKRLPKEGVPCSMCKKVVVRRVCEIRSLKRALLCEQCRRQPIAGEVVRQVCELRYCGATLKAISLAFNISEGHCSVLTRGL